MIYHCSWVGLSTGSLYSRYILDKVYDMTPDIEVIRSLVDVLVDQKKIYAQIIKESTEDSFVFILTNSQLKEFEEWIKQNELEDYVMYKMPRPVTNDVHPENGRNLTLYVLCSPNHPMYDMFNEDEEVVYEQI